MNRSTMAWAALLGAAALFAGCGDDDDDDGSSGGLPELSGPQTGSINVHLANGAVSFPAQPQGIQLSGSAVYDDPADTVTLSLTLRNASTTLLQNPKVVPTNLSEGTITGDGTFAGPLPPPLDGGGDPYIYYGPEAMLSNVMVTREITIDGVTGAAADVSLDVEIFLHPFFAFCSGFREVSVVDSSGSGESAEVDVGSLGFRALPEPADNIIQPFVSSADGRYVFFSCWNQPAVARLDLSDLSISISDSLAPLPLAFDGTGPVGSVDSLTLAPDGSHIYAVLNAGCHSTRSPQTYPAPSVQVVKLDLDLALVAAVEVFPSTVIPPVADGGLTYIEYRGRRLSISDDGTRGAMAVTGLGLVFLLDLDGMLVIDADEGQAGTQGFDLTGTSFEVRHAALSGDASTIYVAYKGPSDGTLDVIDVATGSVTTKAPPTLGAGNSYPRFLELGPDGRLYYGRNDGPSDLTAAPGVSIYDPAGDAWIELPDIASASSIHFAAAFYCVADELDPSIQCFSYADDSTVAAPASGLDAVPAPLDLGHGLVLTDI